MDAPALDRPWDLPIGAPVVTSEGDKPGTVTAANGSELHIPEGIFFRHTYTHPLASLAGYEDGVLILNLTMEQVATLP
jgi:hypothetical protein